MKDNFFSKLVQLCLIVPTISVKRKQSCHTTASTYLSGQDGLTALLQKRIIVYNLIKSITK